MPTVTWGWTRSGEAVARKLGKSAQLIARWSAKWDWVERVAEWGDTQDRANRIAQTDAVEPLVLRRDAKVSSHPPIASLVCEREGASSTGCIRVVPA